MALSRVEGDLYVAGTLAAQSLIPSSASVSDDSIQAAAGIDATKLEHRHQLTLSLFKHTEDAATIRRALHRVYGATATLVKFGVLATVAAGSASSATVQLKKNGVSILSAAITLDSTVTAFDLKEPAGYTSTALVAGDVLEVEITAVSGSTLPKGVTAFLVISEDAN